MSYRSHKSHRTYSPCQRPYSSELFQRHRPDANGAGWWRRIVAVAPAGDREAGRPGQLAQPRLARPAWPWVDTLHRPKAHVAKLLEGAQVRVRRRVGPARNTTGPADEVDRLGHRQPPLRYARELGGREHPGERVVQRPGMTAGN